MTPTAADPYPLGSVELDRRRCRKTPTQPDFALAASFISQVKTGVEAALLGPKGPGELPWHARPFLFPLGEKNRPTSLAILEVDSCE